MHITTQQIQTAAAAQLAAVRRRAAEHLATARGRVGDSDNMNLGSMVDALAAQVRAPARFAAELCTMAGDTTMCNRILADLGGTEHTLQRTSMECRLASMDAWPAPTVAVADRVLQ